MFLAAARVGRPRHYLGMGSALSKDADWGRSFAMHQRTQTPKWCGSSIPLYINGSMAG
jgi:hypothetical protein